MIITLLEGVKALPGSAELIDVSPAEFLNMISDEDNAPSLPCRSEEEKRAGGGFIFAQYRRNATSKRLTDLAPDSATEIFCFDIDKMTLEEIAASAAHWPSYDCAIYSTFKHRPEAPRLRLLVALDTPVRNRRDEYLPLYLAAAEQLRLKYDPSTIDPARLFFGPQHHPDFADCTERHRFHGAPVNIEALRATASAPLSQVEEWKVEGGNRPGKQALKTLSQRLSKSSTERLQKIGAAVESLTRSESFAPEGSRHNATANLAFELVREWRRLDAAWFAGEYLEPVWKLWEAEQPRTMNDWMGCVESAQRKLAENEQQRVQQRAAFSPEEPKAEQDVLDRAKELRGKLIVSHRTNYYLFSPERNAFRGPFRPAEVATAFRDCLGCVPGVTEVIVFQNGATGLKGASALTHEYGTTIDQVYFYARKPPAPYLPDHDAICMEAYRWNRFEPVHHQIAEELLEAVAGKHIQLLLAYLSKFRDLDQPLPALTLVGPKGVWKSRICQTLSRFWGAPDAPTPSMAQQVMLRFNGALLHNPVVWSDEELAHDGGKRLAEKYRQSISERVHSVEHKGAEMVSLYSALRHVISVNDASKVFSHEVDHASIRATMERFLVLEIDGDSVADFERRWAGSPELERLREGTSLLEHVEWIEANLQFASSGRLFVEPDTDAELLLRARFADETLYYCWMMALESLQSEARMSQPGQPGRCALFADGGVLRLNPTRVQAQWNDSKSMGRTGLRAPSPQRIGILLAKSGFKQNQKERASKHSSGGWEVHLQTLKQFLDSEDLMSWNDFLELIRSVYKCELIGQ